MTSKNVILVDEYQHFGKSATSSAVLVTSGIPRGGLGCSIPPQNSEGLPKSCKTQPDCENLKIAEFRMPTPQDVWEKGSRILKLPRLAFVLH